jgi:hypothetical protein
LNYPQSRGTATAFPLAAFGLSAFFFSTISTAFADDTSVYLLILASGTFVLPVLSFFFLRILPPHTYQNLFPTERQPLHRTSLSEGRRPPNEPGAPQDLHKSSSNTQIKTKDADEMAVDRDEVSSLLSRSSTSSPNLESQEDRMSDANHESLDLDIRGFALLSKPEFWLLFSMLGVLTGIGLMTIKSVPSALQAPYANSIQQYRKRHSGPLGSLLSIHTAKLHSKAPINARFDYLPCLFRWSSPVRNRL